MGMDGKRYEAPELDDCHSYSWRVRQLKSRFLNLKTLADPAEVCALILSNGSR